MNSSLSDVLSVWTAVVISAVTMDAPKEDQEEVRGRICYNLSGYLLDTGLADAIKPIFDDAKMREIMDVIKAELMVGV